MEIFFFFGCEGFSKATIHVYLVYKAILMVTKYKHELEVVWTKSSHHHNLHFVCKIKDTRFVQHVNVNKKTMPDHAPCPMNMTYGFVCVRDCGSVAHSV